MNIQDYACQGFQVILSDLCHDTLGVAAADVARSLQLASHAARLALSESAYFPGVVLSLHGIAVGNINLSIVCSMTCFERAAYPGSHLF